MLFGSLLFCLIYFNTAGLPGTLLRLALVSFLFHIVFIHYSYLSLLAVFIKLPFHILSTSIKVIQIKVQSQGQSNSSPQTQSITAIPANTTPPNTGLPTSVLPTAPLLFPVPVVEGEVAEATSTLVLLITLVAVVGHAHPQTSPCEVDLVH